MTQISVIMPVYNAESYLSEAIGSIVSQTFSDFEFIIVNDGSTDSSVDIIESYRDSRIVRLHNQENMGLTSSLNKALYVACGRYIARMDADDISLTSRLERQHTFLEANPLVGVLGTTAIQIDERGINTTKISRPVDHNEAVWSLVWGNPFIHSTVMARRTLLVEADGYQWDGPAQDRELWIRLYRTTKFANLVDPLLLFRAHPLSVTSKRRLARKGHIPAQHPEPDLILRKKYIDNILAGEIDINVISDLTESQRPQVTLNSGLGDFEIRRVVALMIEIFRALVDQGIFVGDHAAVEQDLLQRIIIASRNSPECVLPGRLLHAWNRPLQRRFLALVHRIAVGLNIWPEYWK